MRPHWRKMTWVVIAWCTLIVVWAISAGGTAESSRSKCVSEHVLSEHTCESLSNAGAGIGIAIILLIGFFGFVFFSLIWFMTRPKGRECPVCGEPVKRGLTSCAKCGHNFAVAVSAS
jgi:hypothetical protein